MSPTSNTKVDVPQPVTSTVDTTSSLSTPAPFSIGQNLSGSTYSNPPAFSWPVPSKPAPQTSANPVIGSDKSQPSINPLFQIPQAPAVKETAPTSFVFPSQPNALALGTAAAGPPDSSLFPFTNGSSQQPSQTPAAPSWAATKPSPLPSSNSAPSPTLSNPLFPPIVNQQNIADPSSGAALSKPQLVAEKTVGHDVSQSPVPNWLSSSSQPLPNAPTSPAIPPTTIQPPKPDPRPKVLDFVANELVREPNGLAQQIIEFMLPEIYKKSKRKVERERERERVGEYLLVIELCSLSLD